MTAPLVRHFVHNVVQSVPFETVLRLSFVRSLWRDESIHTSNASSRLSNIYDCSAETVVEDLKRLGIQPLAAFVQRYPTQSQVSQATFSLFTTLSQEVIQDVVDFDTRLAEFCQTHQPKIAQARAHVEATCPMPMLDEAGKLTAKKQDELCFQWSYYLAIADSLEPERRKLVRLLKPGEQPPNIVVEKCRHFLEKLKELLDYTRRNKPPQVLRTWLDEVEDWIQRSRLAFPDYQSADQARKAKKRNALARYEQLLDEPSRQRLASIGEFTLRDDGEFCLTVTYKKLKELACGWSPMSLQVLFDLDIQNLEFTEADKARALNALERFTTDILLLRASAIEYAKDMNFELMQKGKWVLANKLADDQLLRSVKKLAIQVAVPRPSLEDLMATLELDCDWDIEHGVRFGLLPNNQIIIQP